MAPMSNGTNQARALILNVDDYEPGRYATSRILSIRYEVSQDLTDLQHIRVKRHLGRLLEDELDVGRGHQGAKCRVQRAEQLP